MIEGFQNLYDGRTTKRTKPMLQSLKFGMIWLRNVAWLSRGKFERAARTVNFSWVNQKKASDEWEALKGDTANGPGTHRRDSR